MAETYEGILELVKENERLRAENAALQTAVEQLTNQITEMQEDWDTLNQIHNDRANAQGWCPTYECNQLSHNARFKVLKLKPRPGYQHYVDNGALVAENAWHSRYSGGRAETPI